ncbi:hypothetical protein J437_LFUL010913, partial [Ladona fulva]
SACFHVSFVEPRSESTEEEGKPEEVRYVCPICEDVLSSQHLFTVHIRSHNAAESSSGGGSPGGSKAFSCRICGKALSSSSSLDRHMLVHSGERPFKCKLCGVAFTTNGNMHRHMRTHATATSKEAEEVSDGGSSDSGGSKRGKTPGRKRQVEGVKGRRKGKEGGWRCLTCDLSFTNHRDLRLHAYMTHRELEAEEEDDEEEVEEEERGRKRSRRAEGTPTLGFRDLTFVDFSTSKFPLIAKAACEKSVHRASSEFHRFHCGRCDRAFPCGSALHIHADSLHGSNSPAAPSADPKEDFFAVLNLQNKTRCCSSPPQALKMLRQNSPSLSHLPPAERKRREEEFDNAFYFNATKEARLAEENGEEALEAPKDLADISSIISAVAGNASGLMRSVEDEEGSEEEEEEQEEEDATFAAELREMKSRGEFPCKLCPSVFPNLRALKGHGRYHVAEVGEEEGEEERHPCCLCGRRVAKHALARHLRSHNGERPFRCALCRYAFTTKANCERHLRNRHSKVSRDEVRRSVIYSPVGDDQCEGEMETKPHESQIPSKLSTLLSVISDPKHGLESLGKPIGRTEEKSKISDDEEDLRSKGRIDDFIISAVAGNASGLMRSVEDEEGSEEEEEEQEEEDATFAAELREMKSRGEFPCKLCPSVFPNLRALKGHGRYHVAEVGEEEGEEERHPCCLCGRRVAKHALARHLRSHNGERPFRCALCRYAFTTKANCERHLRNRHSKVSRDEVRRSVIYSPVGDDQCEGEMETKPHESQIPSKLSTLLSVISDPKHGLESLGKPIGRTEEKSKISDDEEDLRSKGRIDDFNKTVISEEVKNAIAQQLKSKLIADCRSAFSPSVRSDDAKVINAKEEARKGAKNSKEESNADDEDNSGELVIDEEKVEMETECSGDRGGNSITKEDESSGVDLASVSKLLDNASTQTFQQYFKSEEDDEADERRRVGEGHGGEEGYEAGADGEDEEEEEGWKSGDDSGGSKGASSGEEERAEREDSLERKLASVTVEAATAADTEDKGKRRSAYSSAPNRVSCPYCMRKFPWRSSLRRHILTHTGQKPYKCAHCPLLFTTKSNCDRHLLRKHGKGSGGSSSGAEDAVSVLNSSGSGAVSPGGAYAMRNVPERPYKCSVCPSSTFSTQNNLKKHLATKHQHLQVPNNGRCSTSPKGGSEKDEEKVEMETECSGDRGGNSITKEDESSGVDLASVSKLLDNASTQTFQQYFKSEEDDEADERRRVGEGHGGEEGYEAGADGEDEEEEEGWKSGDDSGGSKGASSGEEERAEREDSLERKLASVTVEAATAADTEDKGKRRSAYSSAPNRVSCPYCMRKFPWRSSLRRHILTHTGQKPYKCAHCPLLFTTKSNCDRHLLRKHGKGSGGSSSGAEDAVSVLNSSGSGAVSPGGAYAMRNVPERPYKCSVCPSSTFSTQNNLKKHLATKHQHLQVPNNGRCSTSPKGGSEKGGSISSASSPRCATEEKDMDDEEDEEGLVGAEDEEGLLEEEDEGEEGSGVEGEKVVKKKKNGSEEINEVQRREQVNGEEHGKSKDHQNIHNHQVVPHQHLHHQHHHHHPGSDLPFKCHLCERSYAERNDALNHIRDSHTSEYELLVAKGALDSAAAVTSEDPHNNNNHGSVYHNNNNISGLDQGGEENLEQLRGKFPDYANRKVVCAFCMRRFWSAEDLRRHMRTHTGERPFSCDICARRFTLKHSMLRHRKKHSSSERALGGNPMVAATSEASGDEDASTNKHREAPNTNWPKEEEDKDTKKRKLCPQEIGLKPSIRGGAAALGGDLIGNLLGIQDGSIIDKMLLSKSANDAAKLLGVESHD